MAASSAGADDGRIPSRASLEAFDVLAVSSLLPNCVSMWCGGRKEGNQLCYFSSSDLCLIAQSFAAAIFTQNIPHISCLSLASFVYFVQEHVRWLLMCLLKLPSGTDFLFVGRDWRQSFTKPTGCLPASLHSCVLRTCYTTLSYARLHRC